VVQPFPAHTPSLGPLTLCVGLVVTRGKELKRVTLLELVDYVNSAGGQKVRAEPWCWLVLAMVGCWWLGTCRWVARHSRHTPPHPTYHAPLSPKLPSPPSQILTDAVVPEVVRMISVNIFRALPPQVRVCAVRQARHAYPRLFGGRGQRGP
jgi:hypothetical protein